MEYTYFKHECMWWVYYVEQGHRFNYQILLKTLIYASHQASKRVSNFNDAINNTFIISCNNHSCRSYIKSRQCACIWKRNHGYHQILWFGSAGYKGYKIVYRCRKLQNLWMCYFVDYFIQTLSFLLNLALRKFRRGIVARLTHPYINVNSSSIGSADEDCQYYAAEVNVPKSIF